MSKFSKIIKNHNETFYNYDTDERVAIWPRIAVICLASLLLVAFMSDIDDTAISAILTVQSILMGFSFSVLFFLLSTGSPAMTEDGSIERGIARKKVATLSRELFFNVSYFNLVAVFSTFLSLILLLSNYDSVTVVNWLGASQLTQSLAAEGAQQKFHAIALFFNGSAQFLLYFLIAESMYTFARTVGRVSFYFEKKLSLEKKSPN